MQYKHGFHLVKPMKNKIDNLSNKLEYEFRPAKLDRRHLLVIFISEKNEPSLTKICSEIYSSCGSHILKIKGGPLGFEDIYISPSIRKDIESSILSLVQHHLDMYHLSKDLCTLSGFSLGARFSIYFGIKYNFKNLIVSCPQFSKASLQKYNLTEDNTKGYTISNKDLVYIDECIISMLRGDDNVDKNIYLITSPSDNFYPRSTELLIPYLNRYTNFNLFFTKSSLATQSSSICTYNIPIILSILLAHGDGIQPKYGQVVNGVEHHSATDVNSYLQEQANEKHIVVDLENIEFKKYLLHIYGVGFIRGIKCPEYKDIKHSLILSGVEQFEFPLGKIINKDNGITYYDSYFCDYSAASFTTLGHHGIDLSLLPNDKYEVLIKINCMNVELTSPPTIKSPLSNCYILKNRSAIISYVKKRTYITIDNIKNSINDNQKFLVKDKWTNKFHIHYEGIFAIKGLKMYNWGDGQYFLSLQNESSTYTFPLGMLALDEHIGFTSGNEHLYSKASFSSYNKNGVDIRGIPKGIFKSSIILVHSGEVFTAPTSDTISWDGEKVSFMNLNKVAVIGSCVTRDNFNSKFNSEYKNRYLCEVLQHQSSIISLTSSPLNLQESSLSDIDEWSRNHIIRDFRKTIWEELSICKPDIIIFDLFTDARFSCLQINNSVVTLNEWKLMGTSYYKTISNNKKIGFTVNEDDFITKFKLAVIEIKKRLDITCPSSKIILNVAKGAFTYLDSGEIKTFNQRYVAEINRRWELLDKIFIDVFSPLVIDAYNKSETIGDAKHPWGLGYVHYHVKFYNDFIRILDEIV